MKKVLFADFFAGIGGFRLGIELAADKLGIPVQCVFSSEIEKNARYIYEKNFKERPHGDITKIQAGDIPDIDILCGGFPCQDVSIAGKREGVKGKRTKLFFDIIRILQEKKPNIVFLENVKGLLSANRGWDFARVLIELENLGYDVEWDTLNSKDFGVPQNRERVFIIGYLRDKSVRKIFPLSRFSQKNDYVKKPSKTPIVRTLTAGGNSGGNHSGMTILLSKTVRSGGLSSPYGSKQNWDTYNINGKIRRLTPLECERLQGFPDNWTVGISDTARYKCLGNAVTVNVIQVIAELILTREANKQ
ncbi:DNA cytosine methyltransferase [Methanosarcina sp. T3]|uniref:DNA cytosine methyltransferase n=1 Tax=Methanosarcina sp. T3 TaxID=3439062 RepID=UPI003F847965